MTHIQEIIQRAIDRISVPGQWCQRAWARDKGGHATDCHGPDAVSWCAVGAIMREAESSFDATTESVLRCIAEANASAVLGVSATNDTYATNERVIAMMQAALT